MNRFFLFFLFFVFTQAAWISYPYDFYLKKDEIAKFNVYYFGNSYPFDIRWTLYKNKNLIVIYHYDKFPRQVVLFDKPPINGIKIKIADFPLNTPYLLIKFLEFDKNRVLFELTVLNSKKVGIERLE